MWTYLGTTTSTSTPIITPASAPAPTFITRLYSKYYLVFALSIFTLAFNY